VPAGPVHLLHGEQDGVIPVAWAEQAAQQLQALGAAVTLDRMPGLGHGVDMAMARQVLARLG
jgi:phospholipase/carboxylesterase